MFLLLWNHYFQKNEEDKGKYNDDNWMKGWVAKKKFKKIVQMVKWCMCLGVCKSACVKWGFSFFEVTISKNEEDKGKYNDDNWMKEV